MGKADHEEITILERADGICLKQAESDAPIEAVCPIVGVSHQTFYRWREKVGDLGVMSFGN